MKKQLIALVALCAVLSLSAGPLTTHKNTRLHPELRPELRMGDIQAPTTSPAKVKAQANESEPSEVYYTLANSPYTALGFNGQTAGMQIAMGTQIEPSFLAQLTDAKITSISFYTGYEYGEGSGVNKVKKATVFITDDLTSGEFLYTQETSLPETAFTEVTVPLDTPFEIPADKEIYVGMYCSVAGANSQTVVIDYTGHDSDLGGWVGYRQNSLGTFTWSNISTSYGFVNVGCTISAYGFPMNSVAVEAVDGQPVACAGDQFTFQFRIKNEGANEINSLRVEYGIEGETPKVNIYDLPAVGFNAVLYGTLSNYIAENPTKSAPVYVKVLEVNDVPNTSDNPSGSYNITIVPADNVLPRNVVIEEFTSIGCQFCPVGYTGMEEIRENCTDGTIIPVCVHVNFGKTDPMTAASYNAVYTRYNEGLPSTTLNRMYSVYPYYEDLVDAAEEIKMLPGIGHVSATASIDEESGILTVNTSTRFVFDYTDADQYYRLAYGITEDDLGPYAQTNGYSGYEQEVPGGWQDKDDSVNLIFNDVARQLDKYAGIVGSVPAEITAGESYEFTHEVKLLKAIEDYKKIHLVVYLINRKSGIIENACVLHPDQFSGVSSIFEEDKENAPAEYFNLQGIRVNNPGHGLYILRQGSKASKVIL